MIKLKLKHGSWVCFDHVLRKSSLSNIVAKRIPPTNNPMRMNPFTRKNIMVLAGLGFSSKFGRAAMVCSYSYAGTTGIMKLPDLREFIITRFCDANDRMDVVLMDP